MGSAIPARFGNKKHPFTPPGSAKPTTALRIKRKNTVPAGRDWKGREIPQGEGWISRNPWLLCAAKGSQIDSCTECLSLQPGGATQRWCSRGRDRQLICKASALRLRYPAQAQSKYPQPPQGSAALPVTCQNETKGQKTYCRISRRCRLCSPATRRSACFCQCSGQCRR